MKEYDCQSLLASCFGIFLFGDKCYQYLIIIAQNYIGANVTRKTYSRNLKIILTKFFIIIINFLIKEIHVLRNNIFVAYTKKVDFNRRN